MLLACASIDVEEVPYAFARVIDRAISAIALVSASSGISIRSGASSAKES